MGRKSVEADAMSKEVGKILNDVRMSQGVSFRDLEAITGISRPRLQRSMNWAVQDMGQSIDPVFVKAE